MTTVNFFRLPGQQFPNISKWNLHLVLPLSLFNAKKLEDLLLLLSHVSFNDLVEDQISWSASSEGMYSVSDEVRILVQSNFVTTPYWPKVIWGNNVPSKVMLFHWLAIRNNIPVKDVLFKRHILPSSQSNMRVWCLDEIEIVNHLLLHCKWSFKIWAALFRWWNLSWVLPGSIEEFLFDWFYGMGIKASKFWKIDRRRYHLGNLVGKN
ncbi:uncharacterized protein [Rutidosis leptorrhynchoides]|uniref:uncharacterized protein n=1 Tax=Rutidosis leptorrhynchoides TaxID=125765 RepID=UPI003A99C47A